MAGAPPIDRRARTTRTTPSDYVRTTLLSGAHSSSRLLVASDPRQLCHMDHSAAELPKPHPSRAHSSAFGLISSPPASHMDHSAAELPKPHPSDVFAPRSASMLHCTYPRAASTIPKIVCRPVLFLRFGAEAYSQRATDEHSGIKGLATGTSLTKIAHRPAYTFADEARPTFAGPPRTTGTAI